MGSDNPAKLSTEDSGGLNKDEVPPAVEAIPPGVANFAASATAPNLSPLSNFSCIALAPSFASAAMSFAIKPAAVVSVFLSSSAIFCCVCWANAWRAWFRCSSPAWIFPTVFLCKSLFSNLAFTMFASCNSLAKLRSIWLASISE